MYVGRYRPGVPASGTRDRRLRGYLVSSARCPRVETDLAAAANGFVLNLDQSILGPTIGSSIGSTIGALSHRWYFLRAQGLDGVGSARKASKAMPKAKKRHKYK